jgi:ethylbenzene dioxygenase beta subunit
MIERMISSSNISREALLAMNGNGDCVSMEVCFEIQQFLYREARLLINEQLDLWFENLADDLVYWAPLRENRFRKNEKRMPEISINRCALFDEDKASIAMRLKRLNSGKCWTDDPPTRQVYAISNVEAFHTEQENEFEVHSVFTLYRSRFERDDSTLMGRRKDILRKTPDGYQLAGRLILLQQSTLLAKNLSSFF